LIVASPLRRFLHLERPRRDAPASGGLAARGRFDAVEIGPALAGGASPVPPSATDRFREPEGSGLALDRAPDGEQPFVRCAACEADHARRALRCDRCGVSLDTPEQRAFNERLWAGQRREADEEERAGDARREALGRDAEQAALDRRALAEAMADEILRRERERLGQPWIFRLLARLEGLISRSRPGS
jgi:hypothetical protein